MTTPISPAFERVPETGEAMEIAAGVFWIRMPLELTGLDHINVWLLRDYTGWAIVDTGMNSALIREQWDAIIDRYCEGRPLKRVVCTHFHPDHMGLAGWLQQKTGCHLLSTRLEWLMGRMLYLDAQPEVPAFVLDHYRRVGMEEGHLEEVRRFFHNRYRDMVAPIPEHYVRMQERDVLTIGDHEWWVIVGTGHAPEHACLYSRELNMMISGDQILPKITPHIGVYPAEAEANPLQEYLDSIERFRMLPEDVLVLPAHNEPFYGLHTRIDALAEHHDQRLIDLETTLAEPRPAVATLDALYRRELAEHERVLGVGEALAHLNCLIEQGRVMRQADDDGRWSYHRTNAAPHAA
ncbi:MAG: MBL fold metallo-hydrolase [Alphaproteobacteria bacterium]|jgi:glyoxylase-like metal-dependent hydrolase (beta-lactamase superfamily II)|nr:MBL fold metallo-hydrolase [Alphaproteobacteria bacterium]